MKEALKLALESAYLAGFNASGEGYNGEYPFGDKMQDPTEDIVWKRDLDNYIKEALAEQHLQALHDENVRLGLYASEASMHSNDRMTVDPITGNVSIGTVAQPDQEPDRFCDANCTWSDHHPDCKYGTQEPACSGCGKTNTTDSQWACYCVDCWTKAQPEQNLNCKSVQARLATAWGYVKAEQEPVKIAHKHQWFRTGEMKVGQMRCISCGTWGQEDRPQQPKNQKQRPFTKKQRDTLCTVYAISSASTTANSLPNIAKIVNELLTEDLEVQPKEPEQSTTCGEPVAWAEFDGEGGYHFLAYENNEDYAEQWDKRNPNHVGWVKPLYATPPQRTWVDLTDEDDIDWEEGGTFKDLVKAIGAKLKEKNT